MDRSLFDNLLHEVESTSLDFKRDQYALADASKDQKSEIVKDILGFVNCWRRSDAYILIGVSEKDGAADDICGVSSHLEDANLQQLVNSKTNTPVDFAYESFVYDGLKIGVIRIPLQDRPVYLTKDYGKLKKNQVYVRRGTSTDVSRPADPDEIKQMGAMASQASSSPILDVSFIDDSSHETSSSSLRLTCEYLVLPQDSEIPDFGVEEREHRIGGRTFSVPDVRILTGNFPNASYYRDLAHHAWFTRFFFPVRLSASNTGATKASNVRLEIALSDDSAIRTAYSGEEPEPPTAWRGHYDGIRASARQAARSIGRTTSPGTVEITRAGDRQEVAIDFGHMQPGRIVSSDSFFLGATQSGITELPCRVFASELFAPLQPTLTIEAKVDERTVSVDEICNSQF